jgi:O-methyltransferase involved in polyketide biosynthesis
VATISGLWTLQFLLLTVRAAAIDRLVSKYINENAGCQIISLGAGFDTTYFRFHSSGANFSRFIEVDFPDLVKRKSDIIMSTDYLKTEIENPVVSERGEISSRAYALVGCDLLDQSALHQKLLASGVLFDAPTLLLSECVLTYVSCGKADTVCFLFIYSIAFPSRGTHFQLIEWCSTRFSNAIFLCYEQVLLMVSARAYSGVP